MKVFSGTTERVEIDVDSGVLRYLAGRLAGLPRGSSGRIPTVRDALTALVHSTVKGETDRGEAAEHYTAAERGVLTSLFVLAGLPGWSEGLPWLTRVEICAHAGFSALTVAGVTRALEKKGDMRSRDQISTTPGQRGPRPLVYTLTPRGVEAAFKAHALIEPQAAAEYAYEWEQRVGLHAAPELIVTTPPREAPAQPVAPTTRGPQPNGLDSLIAQAQAGQGPQDE